MARFVGRLAATLVCTTFVTVQFPTPLGQAQVQPQDISAYAQKITVRIDGQQEGSGFIMEKSGNLYTVLTNWHVVDEAGAYSVTTVDGQKHNVNYRSVQQLPGLDAARLQFESSRNYEQADFGNSDELSPGQQVFFAGYPQEIRGEPGRNYTFQAVSIKRILSRPNDKGYALVYNGEALPGMSGGPVLNSSNNVIGIHGEANISTPTRAVSLYAIPINPARLSLEKLPILAATFNLQEDDYISSLAFSLDGKILASASSDKTIKLWDVKNRSLLTTLTGHEGNINHLDFSPNGKILASASLDKTIKLWDVKNRSLLTTLTGHESSISSITFRPDGDILTSVSSGKIIKLWDVEKGSLLATITEHENSLRYPTILSPNGKILASASSEDKIIKLWDIEKGSLLATLTGHGDRINSITFRPDGRILASTSLDKTIKLWDMEKGSLLATHEIPFYFDITFSPDGKILAGKMFDTNFRNIIKLWDVERGSLLATLTGHKTPVRSIAFSPNGRILASASGGSSGGLELGPVDEISQINFWRIP